MALPATVKFKIFMPYSIVHPIHAIFCDILHMQYCRLVKMSAISLLHDLISRYWRYIEILRYPKAYIRTKVHAYIYTYSIRICVHTRMNA